MGEDNSNNMICLGRPAVSVALGHVMGTLHHPYRPRPSGLGGMDGVGVPITCPRATETAYRPQQIMLLLYYTMITQNQQEIYMCK